MKLVILLYLEEDDAAVMRLLEKHGVNAFSRLPLEGVGAGAAGWYGDVAPYRSRMVFTLLSGDQASELLSVVRACTDCQDHRHPIHALQVDVEDAARSGTDGVKKASAGPDSTGRLA